MNLYAICGAYQPGSEVTFLLAATDDEAMVQGTLVAARDIADMVYGSPFAEVFLVAANVRKVGDAYATDAPKEWAWAHPAVEETAAQEICDEIQRDVDGSAQ